MLVFKADLVGAWGLATGTAQLNLALVDPSLVGGRVFDVFGRVHVGIEVELLHEAWVWLADGPCLANVRQGFRRADVVLLHQISDDDGS